MAAGAGPTASQALFRAKLLADEMPHEIEEVFAVCGTFLFPRSATDLDMHCSCPDWAVPCKYEQLAADDTEPRATADDA